MIEINGRNYPLWSQFVENKEKWLGGTLQDFGDSFDIRLGLSGYKTEIINITLKPNGPESAFFSVIGKDFSCGFDVQFGSIIAGEEGWITFSGYMDHKWRIKNI